MRIEIIGILCSMLFYKFILNNVIVIHKANFFLSKHISIGPLFDVFHSFALKSDQFLLFLIFIGLCSSGEFELNPLLAFIEFY